MLQKLNEKQNIHICIAFTAMMPHIDNFCFNSLGLKSSVIMTVCVNITLKKQTVKLQPCESCI